MPMPMTETAPLVLLNTRSLPRSPGKCPPLENLCDDLESRYIEALTPLTGPIKRAASPGSDNPDKRRKVESESRDSVLPSVCGGVQSRTRPGSFDSPNCSAETPTESQNVQVVHPGSPCTPPEVPAAPKTTESLEMVKALENFTALAEASDENGEIDWLARMPHVQRWGEWCQCDVRVEQAMVGKMIGRTGETIMRIRQEVPGATVEVDQTAKHLGFSLVRMSAITPMDMQRVFKAMGEVLQELQSQERIRMEHIKNGNVGVLEIRQQFVGKVIGLGGANVQRLRAMHGTDIQVDQSLGQERGLSTAQITGPPAGVQSCMADIRSMMLQLEKVASFEGSESVWWGKASAFAPDGSWKGEGFDKGFGKGKGAKGKGIQTWGSETINIRKEFVGAIIGKGGWMIKSIRDWAWSCLAEVTVEQTEGGGQIHLRGEKTSVDKLKTWVLFSVGRLEASPVAEVQLQTLEEFFSEPGTWKGGKGKKGTNPWWSSGVKGFGKSYPNAEEKTWDGQPKGYVQKGGKGKDFWGEKGGYNMKGRSDPYNKGHGKWGAGGKWGSKNGPTVHDNHGPNNFGKGFAPWDMNNTVEWTNVQTSSAETSGNYSAEEWGDWLTSMVGNSDDKSSTNNSMNPMKGSCGAYESASNNPGFNGGSQNRNTDPQNGNLTWTRKTPEEDWAGAIGDWLGLK